MTLIARKNTPRDMPLIAQVTFSESAGFGAMGESEKRNIPVFAPRGMSYRPCEGDNLLLLPVEGAYVCLGVLCAEEEAGEVSIASSGGARIELKNTGEIILNHGVRITKDGHLVEAPGQ